MGSIEILRKDNPDWFTERRNKVIKNNPCGKMSYTHDELVNLFSNPDVLSKLFGVHISNPYKEKSLRDIFGIPYDSKPDIIANNCTHYVLGEVKKSDSGRGQALNAMKKYSDILGEFDIAFAGFIVYGHKVELLGAPSLNISPKKDEIYEYIYGILL